MHLIYAHHGTSTRRILTSENAMSESSRTSPHGRDIDACDAAQRIDAAAECPSSQPPYAIRHGYLSQKRQEGVPDRILSERCDVSAEIIDKHYDERIDEEKRELRQRVLAEIREQRSEGGYL